MLLTYDVYMKKLWYELKGLCESNLNGSRNTQSKRYRDLRAIAKTLESLGYRNMGSHSLKPKHIETLVDHWKSKSLSTGTIKTRMSVLRWWAGKVGRHNVVARENSHYGIGRRVYVTEHSKACHVAEEILRTIKDPYISASMRLAKMFGLRKEEAIKFNASYANKGDHIQLKGSWCKGGRPRVVPILTQEQRYLLDEIKRLVGANSLIPSNKKFIQQYKRYEEVTRQLGLRNLHGLRHAYAQERYKQLTGWDCSHRGGLKYKQMSLEQKKVDREIRLVISKELGHNRIDNVAIYIGA